MKLVISFIFAIIILSNELYAGIKILKSSDGRKIFLEYSLSESDSSGTYKVWNLTENYQVGTDINKSSGSVSEIIDITQLNPNDHFVLLNPDGIEIGSVLKNNTSSSSVEHPSTKPTLQKKLSAEIPYSKNQTAYVDDLRDSILRQIEELEKLANQNSVDVNVSVELTNDQWDLICNNSAGSASKKNIIGNVSYDKSKTTLLNLCNSRAQINYDIKKAYSHLSKTESLSQNFKKAVNSNGASFEQSKPTEKEQELSKKFGETIKQGNASNLSAEKWEKWKEASKDYYLFPEKYDSLKITLSNENNKEVGGYLSQATVACGDYNQASNAYATHIVLAMHFHKMNERGEIGIPKDLCKLLGEEIWCTFNGPWGKKFDGPRKNINNITNNESIKCPNRPDDFFNNRPGWATGVIVDESNQALLGEMIMKGHTLEVNPLFKQHRLHCSDEANAQRDVHMGTSITDEKGVLHFEISKVCPSGSTDTKVFTRCYAPPANGRNSPLVSLSDFMNGTPVKCPDFSKIMIDCQHPFGNYKVPWGTKIRTYSSNRPCENGKCPAKEHVCEDNGKWSNLPFGGEDCQPATVSMPQSGMSGMPAYICGDHNSLKCPTGYSVKEGFSKKCSTDFECNFLWPRNAEFLKCPVTNVYLGKIDCQFICPK